MRLADVIRNLDKPNELQLFPDPKVISAGIGAKSQKLRLADHVRAVKTGTPLKAEGDRWVIAEDNNAEMIAATFGQGGAEIHAYRALTLDIYRNPRENGLPGFYAGDRLRISELDPYGRPTFETDLFGRWFAINETTVGMDCATPVAKKRFIGASLTEDAEDTGVDLP